MKKMNKKASQVSIGTSVKSLQERTARIIANFSRQGDEVVVIEYDDNFEITAANINDLEVVNT